jgi:hypothetical protein
VELPALLNEATNRWRALPLNAPPGSRDAEEARVLGRIMDVAEDALTAGLLAETTGPHGAPCWSWAPEYARLDEAAPFESSPKTLRVQDVRQTSDEPARKTLDVRDARESQEGPAAKLVALKEVGR